MVTHRLSCLVLGVVAGCAGASSVSSPHPTTPAPVAEVAHDPHPEPPPPALRDEVWPERWASRRWEAPLARAREAYAAARFAEAAALYLEADRHIGSFDAYDDDLGCWRDEARTRWTPMGEGRGWAAPGAPPDESDEGRASACGEQAIPAMVASVRQSFQCEWALSALVVNRPDPPDASVSQEEPAREPTPSEEDSASRAEDRADRWYEATKRSAQCDAGGRAVSALLRDRPFEAALHATTALPAPFSHLVIPQDARLWADAVRAGVSPSLPTLEAAQVAVAAHAALALGVTVTCHPPEGAAMTPSAWARITEEGTVAGETAPPFAGVPALAFIQCRYDARRGEPYSSGDNFGSGSDVGLTYLLQRSASGVRIAGAFTGHEWFDCANGDVSEDISQTIRRVSGGLVYERLFTDGSAADGWEDSRDVLVLCHLETARCRELTVRVTRIEEERVIEQTSVSVTLQRGRLRARSRNGPLPLALAPLAQPVDAVAFLTDGTSLASRLGAVTSTPAPAAEAEPACSVRISDSDGQTNLRPAPSTAGEPIGTLPNGTVVAPAEARGRWMRITAPLAGWVWSGNLSRRCE